MNKLALLIRSRKFWAAMIGLVVLVIKGFWEDFPLESEQITNVVYVLVAYILGTGIEDMTKPQ